MNSYADLRMIIHSPVGKHASAPAEDRPATSRRRGCADGAMPNRLPLSCPAARPARWRGHVPPASPVLVTMGERGLPTRVGRGREPKPYPPPHPQGGTPSPPPHLNLPYFLGFRQVGMGSELCSS